MAKDPAVLFYTSDFLTGTMTMSNEHVGMYIRLLCLQHQKGRLTKNDMIFICKSLVPEILDKFQEIDGFFYNKRMEEESIKRLNYCNSRALNKKGRFKNKNHMKIICKSYENHMENENENEDVFKDLNVEKSSKFKKPTLEDITRYCNETTSPLDPEAFFHYYESVGWVKANGRPVKNWKSTIKTWEKRDQGKKLSPIIKAPAKPKVLEDMKSWEKESKDFKPDIKALLKDISSKL